MAEYKVRIGNIEFVVDSLEALDEIVSRYGAMQPVTTGVPSAKNAGADGATVGSMDRALLRRFVEHAQNGIPTKQLELSLSAKGKGVPGALTKWAERMGLSGGFASVFEGNLYQGKRGFRLTSQAVEAAKMILGS